MNCEKCGHQIIGGDSFCRNCGAAIVIRAEDLENLDPNLTLLVKPFQIKHAGETVEIPAVGMYARNFCTNCGEELRENAMFCSNCGKQVRDIEDVQYVEIPEQQPVDPYAGFNQNDTANMPGVVQAPRLEVQRPAPQKPRVPSPNETVVVDINEPPAMQWPDQMPRGVERAHDTYSRSGSVQNIYAQRSYANVRRHADKQRRKKLIIGIVVAVVVVVIAACLAIFLGGAGVQPAGTY